MRWLNYGEIFSTKKLQEIDESLHYAKSPQFILKENLPTFYCTSQYKDKHNKWISTPFSVSYNEDFSNIVNINIDVLAKSNCVGVFDEHGIFPFSPLNVGADTWAYTTGWSRRKSVDIDMSIGLCISKNGGLFERKFNGPIMTHSLKEPFLVGDAFVQIIDNTFHMWYIFGDKWLTRSNDYEPQRRYRIAHATSLDGINWMRDSEYIIPEHSELECQALPSVIFHEDRYHMVFCYRNVFDFRSGGDNSYKLGYAYSIDGKVWSRDDGYISNISNRYDWDSAMQCYPNIFVYDNQIFCAYNGNDFGLNGFGLAKLEILD